MVVRALAWLPVLLALACGVKTDRTDSTADALSSTGSSGDPGATLGHSQTSTPVDSEPGSGLMSATGSSTGPAESTTDPSSTSAATTIEATTGATCWDFPAQPNDSQCVDETNCGCASGRCFVRPVLGGYCGECLHDDDCPGGGCTPPNFVKGLGARCNEGGPGDGCNTDAACNDPAAPFCALVYDFASVMQFTTCSECRSDADCTDPQVPNCTPVYDVDGLSGVLVCRPDASVPNDGGCSLADEMGAPAGAKACASGFCGEGYWMMAIGGWGICGECLSAEDCGPGQQCSEPVADPESDVLVGAKCV